MNLIRETLFFIFATNFSIIRCLFREVYPLIKKIPITTADDPGKPLFLTPFIKSGKLSEARKLSTVPELLPNIISSSGFLTVNETYDSNMFFWFFQKTSDDWKSAPLILWLQGGPGSSSLFGLFAENGPFVVKKSNILRRRKYSWTNDFNVLYIDNPVGTGFSFTSNDKGYTRCQQDVANDLYSALEQFLKLYPELKTNEFYLTGESYAGKYLPSIATEIDKRNRLSKKIIINMKGLFIGNGYCDPENQMEYSTYLERIGLINRLEKLKFQELEKTIIQLIRSHRWAEANSKLNFLIGDDYSLFQNSTGFPAYYDFTREKGGIDDQFMLRFIQSVETRKAIHVGSLDYNDGLKVYKHLAEDIPKSVKNLIENLLTNYRIMFYSGQLDIIVAYTLSVKFLHNLAWNGANVFNEAVRKKWYVGKHLAGYYKNAGNITEVLVRNAGHMVPTNQPKWALNLLKSFVSDKF